MVAGWERSRKHHRDASSPPVKAMHNPPRPVAILLFDASGGLLAGIGVWLAAGWIAQLYQLPLDAVQGVAAANLLYGLFASAVLLWTRQQGHAPKRAVTALALANMLWPLACMALLWTYGADASVFGWLHLVLEAGYVGGLGLYEWRVLRPQSR